jgi:hypothetical protein
VRIGSRESASDPTFGLLISFALSLGLAPLVPAQNDMRLVLAWSAMAFFALLAWLFGTTTRVGRERLENGVWGGVFGLLLAAPLLFIGSSTLTTTAQLIFRAEVGGIVQPLTPATVLALVVFVMPLAETLFFRGQIQHDRPFWLVGALASVWSILLLIPMIDAGRYPIVALLISVALVAMNMMYSYVCQRNGLAAAWVCQVVVNLTLLFVPFVLVLPA